MSTTEEKNIERFIHLIVGTKETIEFVPLSNLLYVTESLLLKYNESFSLRFKLSPLGVIPNNLEYYLQKMSDNNEIKMQRDSLPIIEKIENGYFEEAKESLIRQYSDVVDPILKLLRMDLSDDDYSQLAKVFRSKRMINPGERQKEQLQERYRLERINIDNIKRITDAISISELAPYLF